MHTRGASYKVKKQLPVSLEDIAQSDNGESLLEGLEEEYARCKEGELKTEQASQALSQLLIHGLEEEYARCKEGELKTEQASQALSQLLIHGLTEEAVWQELELQNRPLLKRLGRIPAPDTPLFLQSQEPSEEDEEEADEVEGDDVDGEEEEEMEDEEAPTSSAMAAEKSDGKGGDRFFSLAAMEQFCDAAESEHFLKGDLDLDGDDEEDGEEEEELYYNDFFDQPESESSKPATSANFTPLNQSRSKMKERDEEEGDESEEDEDDKGGDEDDGQGVGASSHERRRARLAERMGELEEENLAPKSWQLAGEVAGRERPENSLLSEHLGFQHKAKGVPVVTADTTERLEDMLRQRIKDRTWDDVVRKDKPTADPAKFRADLILDQEKSKVSLADVYESEFVKQTQAKEDKEENPRHVEIQRKMTELFRKLDALSNYHYTPKQPLPQLKVVKKVARLGVEDGLSAETAAAAEILAPEEVQAPGPLQLKGSDEADETTKKRERRRKKARQAAVAARKEAAATRSNLTTDTGKALAKIGKLKRAKLDPMSAEGGSAGAKFFGKLESKVREEIATKAGLKAPSAKKTKTSSGAAFKLA